MDFRRRKNETTVDCFFGQQPAFLRLRALSHFPPPLFCEDAELERSFRYAEQKRG